METSIETSIESVKAPRLGNNLAWSLGLAGANYLFPLVVFMHVSRVLGVSGIGLVGFVDSVTVYFILFSMMGITSLGVRTMAQAQATGSRAEMSSAFWSLLTLQGLFTGAVLMAMGVCIYAVPELRAERHLMGIGVCKVVFNIFLAEWAFIGLERFRYITLRTLAVKAAYVVAVFLLVRRADDLWLYYLLTMLVVLVTALVNMWWACRKLSPCHARIEPGRYVRSFFSLGVFELVATTLVPFCMVFLGFCSDDTETGYFSTASKVIVLATGIFAACGQVLAARDSRLLKEGKRDVLAQHRRYGVLGVAGVGVCMCVLVIAFAPQIVYLLAGAGYNGAIKPLYILSATLLVISIEKFLSMQILVPSGKDKGVAVSSIAAFVVCAVVCALLIPKMGACGAAYAWLAAETTQLMLNLLMLRKV